MRYKLASARNKTSLNLEVINDLDENQIDAKIVNKNKI